MKLLELITSNLREEDKKLAALLDFDKTDDEIISSLISEGYISFENPIDHDKEN